MKEKNKKLLQAVRCNQTLTWESAQCKCINFNLSTVTVILRIEK